jgi:two-component system, NarL family, invasion response regulator UvrY
VVSNKPLTGNLIKVLIADDHGVVRDGLRLILEKEFPGCFVGDARNAEETLSQVRRSQWDLVLLDVSMPGKSGLDILGELKQLLPNLHVLIVSMYPESQFAVQALQAGADGYISKDCSRDEFITAIRSSLVGRKYISTRFAEAIASGLARGPEKPPHERLSSREYEVMLAIAGGRAMIEIAKDLSVSAKTISTYRKRLLEKMGMRNNADLTRYVLERKLL